MKPYHLRMTPDLRDKARAVFAFNEGQGSKIRDLLNPSRVVNLRDASGASTYDTWSGGPIGAAFDYNNAVGHFAEQTGAADLTPSSTTIVMHLKASSTAAADKICGVWQDGSPFHRSWLLQVTTTGLLLVPDSNGTQATARPQDTDWKANYGGQWVTVVARAKAGEFAKLWTNGALVATASAAMTNPHTALTEPFNIGSGSTGSGDTTRDQYDEPIALVAVFEALPESQCQYLSANPLGMFTPTRSRMLDIAARAGADAITPTSNRRRRFFVGAAA